MYSNIFIVLVVCVYFGYSKNLPSYIKPCSKSARDFDDCCLQHGRAAISTLVKGDRKYNIPNLSPLVLPELILQSDKSFNLVLKDVSFYGLEAMNLKQMQFDMKGQQIHVKGYLEKVTLIGKYNINGKVLVLPIQGNGDINVTGVGVEIQYDLKYALESNKGEDYIVPKKGKADFTMKTAYFQLDNLFNGNKELGDSTNKLLNEDPVNFLEAIKPVLTETLTKVTNNILDGLLSVVPYKKIFLD